MTEVGNILDALKGPYIKQERHKVKFRAQRDRSNKWKITVTKQPEFQDLDEAKEAYIKLTFAYMKVAPQLVKAKLYGFIVTVLLFISILYNFFG